MSIAFFTYLPLEFGGGVANYYITTAQLLKKKNKRLHITLITFDTTFAKKILALYSFYFFKKQDANFSKEDHHALKKTLKSIQYKQVRNLPDLIQTIQTFDCLYITNNLLEVAIFGLYGTLTQLPRLIIGFHIPQYYPFSTTVQNKLHNYFYQSKVYASVLKRANILHVLNSFDERLLKKNRFKNVVKNYNPFDFDKYVMGKSNKNTLFPFAKKTTHILWVGRLTEQKGVHDLLEIVASINKLQLTNTIHWHIVGEGELYNEIIATTDQWKNVTCYGHITQKTLPYFYKKCDVFLSTAHWESFPYTLLEAQSFGLPVIAYDIPGCHDIIEHEKNGYLVSSLAEYKKMVRYLLQEQPFSKKNIQREIRSKFNYKTSCDKLYNMFFSSK